MANNPFLRSSGVEGAEDPARFEPSDALGRAVQAIAVTGGAGAFISGMQNALAKENRGILGVFTRTGATIAVFAGVGGAYVFTREVSANLREKRDWKNSAIGGFFGGSLIGIRSKAIGPVLAYGAGLAIILSAFEKAGGSLKGALQGHEEHDEVARKQEARETRQVPFEATLAHVGEGRGIYAPGYKERRAQRLKDTYGIEVPVEAVKPYAS